MGDRDCPQCGKHVVLGQHVVKGAVQLDDGSWALDKDLLHYDCLRVEDRNADPETARAAEAAESGIKDHDLQVHLMGESSGS